VKVQRVDDADQLLGVITTRASPEHLQVCPMTIRVVRLVARYEYAGVTAVAMNALQGKLERKFVGVFRLRIPQSQLGSVDAAPNHFEPRGGRDGVERLAVDTQTGTQHLFHRHPVLCGLRQGMAVQFRDLRQVFGESFLGVDRDILKATLQCQCMPIVDSKRRNPVLAVVVGLINVRQQHSIAAYRPH
jgi:hypothetical protein